eukprot:scaffold4705_cov156-Skeletonema_menzelii.AAC.7
MSLTAWSALDSLPTLQPALSRRGCSLGKRQKGIDSVMDGATVVKLMSKLWVHNEGAELSILFCIGRRGDIEYKFEHVRQSEFYPCLFIGDTTIAVIFVDNVLMCWSTDETNISALGMDLRAVG